MQTKCFVTTVDTHTAGAPTRTVTSGIPPLKGGSTAEKRDNFRERFDGLRRLIMREPRGHAGMYGAVLTEPSSAEADLGIFFLTPDGYLDMCVHSAIGTAAACLETGILRPPPAGAPIRLETPAGIVLARPRYQAAELVSLSIETPAAFTFARGLELDIGRKEPIRAGVAFSSVFFVLVDAASLGLDVVKENLDGLRSLAEKIFRAVDESVEVTHPDRTGSQRIALAMLYQDLGPLRARNAVFSRSGSLDRSPCGAGTGAKMAYLQAAGRLKPGEVYTNESLFETVFTGTLQESPPVGPFAAAVPVITGSAYLTGSHSFWLDPRDPLENGL
jgi:proline racemase/trans-L-3-hydroxyproline dehydratase